MVGMRPGAGHICIAQSGRVCRRLVPDGFELPDGAEGNLQPRVSRALHRTAMLGAGGNRLQHDGIE